MDKGADEEYNQMGYKAPRIEILLNQHDQSSYSLLFNERNKGDNLDGKGSWEEQGRVNGGETLIWVYYGRKNHFSIKEERK